MKNLVWIASYPKSGNTMIRLFLSCYFFSKNGILKNFEIIKNIESFNSYDIFNNIENFPKINYFKKNPELISNYWIKAQESIFINHPKKIYFLKTHNAQIKYNSNIFTNKKFTRCFIYVVRDPRSVLISLKYHFDIKNLIEAKERLLSDKHISYAQDNRVPEFLLSWKSNYLSWLNFFKKNPGLGLIIKYEDMVQKKEETFLNIIKFLNIKTNTKFNEIKFNNSLRSIKFKQLQKKESLHGFDDKPKFSNKFFRKGLVDEWQTVLSKKIQLEIENNFNVEMKKLGYL